MELQFVEWLRSNLPPHRCLRIGLGDDAAVLQLVGQADCVVTVDMLSDGVDFHVGEVSAERIGRKALAVNLSDLAAMAARPLAAVVAITLPKAMGWELGKSLYMGMRPLAEEFDVAIAGGDTNSWDHPLAISVTAIGQMEGRPPLTRNGARPGDVVMVTGRFGGSILGHHFDFTPRIREAILLRREFDVHAGIDCSDGLAIDLHRICIESGCGAEIKTTSIPVSDAAHELSRRTGDSISPIEHALHDGEDFELILAVPPAEAARILEEQPLSVPVTEIGRFTEGRGFRQIDESGRRSPLEPHGFTHQLGT